VGVVRDESVPVSLWVFQAISMTSALLWSPEMFSVGRYLRHLFNAYVVYWWSFPAFFGYVSDLEILVLC